MTQLQPLCRAPALIAFVAYALSTNRRAIRIRTVLWGFGLQFLFAVIVLKTPYGQQAMAYLSDKTKAVLGFASVGTSFVFGIVGNQTAWTEAMKKVFGDSGIQYGTLIAFQILPAIIFVAALFAILYHLGIMQIVVRGFAVVMQRVMGVSGAESLNVAASIFHGADRARRSHHPALPAHADRSRSWMTVMTRWDGAHLGRHHGRLHRIRDGRTAHPDRGDHDGAGHDDDGEDAGAGDRRPGDARDGPHGAGQGREHHRRRRAGHLRGAASRAERQRDERNQRQTIPGYQMFTSLPGATSRAPGTPHGAGQGREHHRRRRAGHLRGAASRAERRRDADLFAGSQYDERNSIATISTTQPFGKTHHGVDDNHNLFGAMRRPGDVSRRSAWRRART